MDVLSTQLMKFKWTLRRDNFKSTQIAKEMLKYCNQASRGSLKGQLLKQRKKLFEIISMISFDDVMDSYKENIEKIIEELGQKLSSSPEEVIFDLTGIVTSIDTSTIYRYFLIEFEKKINMRTMMETLFKKFLGDQKLLKAIFKLHLRLIENRSQRLSSTRNSKVLYDLIGTLMPFWNQVLQVAKGENFENIIHQLHKIFRAIVKGGHVSFPLIRRHNEKECDKYIYLILQSMFDATPWVEPYPKHFDLILENGQQLLKELS